MNSESPIAAHEARYMNAIRPQVSQIHDVSASTSSTAVTRRNDSALNTDAEAPFSQSESARSRGEGGPPLENPFDHGCGTVRRGGGAYRMVNAYGNPNARKQYRARGDLARA